MPGSLKQRAYEHIRKKLLTGEFPPGVRLSNRALAKELGISFIPVREAISRLGSEGLVDLRPGVGCFVVRPSRQELEEIYDIREALECHAVEKALGRLTRADLAEMTRWTDVMARVAGKLNGSTQGRDVGSLVEEWVQADTSFHLAFLHAAGNNRAAQIVQGLRTMAHIFGGAWKLLPLHDLKRVCRDHREIVRALREGDGDRARSALARHIRKGLQDVLLTLDRTRARERGESIF